MTKGKTILIGAANEAHIKANTERSILLASMTTKRRIAFDSGDENENDYEDDNADEDNNEDNDDSDGSELYFNFIRINIIYKTSQVLVSRGQ